MTNIEMWSTRKSTVDDKDHFFSEENRVFNFSINKDPTPQNGEENWDTYSLEDYKQYTEKLVNLLHYFKTLWSSV